MPVKSSLVGYTIGELLVEDLIHIKEFAKGAPRSYYICRCSCGNVVQIRSKQLAKGLHKSCGCRYNGLREGESAFNNVVGEYKKAANAKGVCFELTDDQCRILFTSGCSYCGCEPNHIRKITNRGSFTYNGIDRVDSDKGYISTNVVSCCSMCNYAKRHHSVEDFRNWLERASEYLESPNWGKSSLG